MLNEFRSTDITWDRANRRVYEPLRVSAGDNKGRKLSVQVVNVSVVEDLSRASLFLFWETKDKAHNGLDVFTAVDATKGEFEIYYTTGMLSNEGTLNANLVLVDTSGRVVSEPFTITVFKGIDDDAIQSSDSFTALTEALVQVRTINNKADRSELLALERQLQRKVGGGKLATMSDMGQDVKTAMTGGSVAVVGANAVTEENIVDGQVTERKTSFAKSFYNLANVPNMSVGQYYYKNTADNKIGTGTGPDVGILDPIPVKAGILYSVSQQKSSFCYLGDANGNFVSQLNLGSGGGSFTPTVDGFLYFTINAALDYSTLMIVEGERPNRYYPFGVVYKRDIPNLTEYVRKEESNEIFYQEIVVSQDGTGNFSNIKAAVASVAGGTAHNQVNILIKDGIYTENDILLPDFVNLIGFSGNRDKVHIKGELPDSATDEQITQLSTIDIKKSNVLKNLTITARNLRYAVHSESSGVFKDWTQIVENCHIEHFGNQGARDYRTANGGDPNTVWSSTTAWGEGGSSGSYGEFTDSTFIAHEPNTFAWSTHNNLNFTKPMIRKLNNCRFISEQYGSLRAEGLVSGTNDKIFVNNCVLVGNIYCTNSLSIEVVVSGSTPVGSNTTSYFEKKSTAYYSEYTKQMLNNTGATIPKGTLVCFDGNDRRIRKMLESDDASLFAGYTIGDTPAGAYATVITNGYYRYTANLTIGIQYGVADGALSATASNKIGISNGNGFVKVRNPYS